MKRIGIAASKIAKGNIVLYNVYVVIISFLFSLVIFFTTLSSIILALVCICYVLSGVVPTSYSDNWISIIKICIITLTLVVSIVNLLAIFKNIKINKDNI